MLHYQRMNLLHFFTLTSKLLIFKVSSAFLFLASPPKWWPNLAARFRSRAAFSGSSSSSSGTNTLKCQTENNKYNLSDLKYKQTNNGNIQWFAYFLPRFLIFLAFFWNLFGVLPFPSFLSALPLPRPWPLWFLPLPLGLLIEPLKLMNEDILLELVEELLSLLQSYK